ncbi:DUF1642 domain-containing protein [Lacticaseibacillus paracasei]|uniref:DUF1642 domain-containing protein n=1 Tax=Lacticaseibacillus paracasei TaxID=1597 RepID=UPI002FFA0E93
MSEEKLYAVKTNDEKYWDFSDGSGFWTLDISDCPTTPRKEQAEIVADEQGGHVVTFVEEPEKVVLSEEQAKIVEDANKYKFPASYISMNTDDYDGLEDLLMNAYVNGYTVAKEKKYRVLAPRSWWYAVDAPLYLLFSFTEGMRFTVKKDNPSTLFTKEQLSAFGLDGEYFQKEEVTDDEND